MADATTKKFQWSKMSPDRSEQVVVRCDNYDELIEAIGQANEILPKKAEMPKPTSEPEWLEPDTKTAPAVPTTAPICGAHHIPMTWKSGGISKTTGKPYQGFWSCSERMADGSWCRFKPAKV